MKKITKTTQTIYDTNGNKVSVIRQKSIEIDDCKPCLKNREETKHIKQKVDSYKASLNEAVKVRDIILKSHGVKKGKLIFNDMADLIMLKNPMYLTLTRKNTLP